MFDEATETWLFSVIDVIQVLTQQPDCQTARKYWNKLKERLGKEGSQLVTNEGKFVLKIIVGWADSFIVCPRGLVTAWAQKRAHPTFIDFKHNYLKNKLALGDKLSPVENGRRGWQAVLHRCRHCRNTAAAGVVCAQPEGRADQAVAGEGGL